MDELVKFLMSQYGLSKEMAMTYAKGVTQAQDMDPARKAMDAMHRAQAQLLAVGVNVQNDKTMRENMAAPAIESNFERDFGGPSTGRAPGKAQVSMYPTLPLKMDPSVPQEFQTASGTGFRDVYDLTNSDNDEYLPVAGSGARWRDIIYDANASPVTKATDKVKAEGDKLSALAKRKNY